jgi:tetratricopeptide (TPR) repeat protein
VLRSGNRVRITAQLIQAGTDKHLWAESYERELKDILALQRDVGQAIAQEIRITLVPQDKGDMTAPRSVDPEVYQLYLKGRYHWNKRTHDGFDRAIEYFQQALDKDPTYPQAYAGLADSYNLLANYGYSAPKDAFPKADAAALRALEIDGSLAEAHTSLAFALHHYDWDFAGAAREFKRAIELNPGYATAHQWYAEFLTTMGRHDEAVTEILRARELDPLSLVINSNVGRLLFYARRYDQAKEELRNTLELDPNYYWALIHLCMVCAEQGMYAEALQWYQKATRSGEATTVLAYVYAVSGRKKEARKILDGLVRSEKGEDPFFLAGIYAGLGEKDNAIAMLEEAYKGRAFFIVFLGVHPWFDGLRSDPRFISLLARVGLGSATKS